MIDEAVQLAKEFSTDESPAFVNGLLGRFKELKPSLRRDDASRRPARERDGPAAMRSSGPFGMPADGRQAAGGPHARSRVPSFSGPQKAAGVAGTAGSGHPGGTFLLRCRSGQASSWATARRASASRTPQLISCSVRTEGDWS